MPVNVFVLLVVAAVALAGGFGAAYLLLRRRQSNGSSVLELKAQQSVVEAETAAKEKLLEAKEEAVRIRTTGATHRGRLGTRRPRKSGCIWPVRPGGRNGGICPAQPAREVPSDRPPVDPQLGRDLPLGPLQRT